MTLLPPEQKTKVARMLETLQEPVKLVNFTQEFECQLCLQTRELLYSVAQLSDKISFVQYDFQKDTAKVEQFGIEMIPATVVLGERDYGVRFYGFPFGYELGPLLQAIIHVSRRDSQLTPATREALKAITRPVTLKVLVTLTCPYCAGAVSLAHRMAMENTLIRAEMIELMEFPHIAQKYSVRGVPRTIINETGSVDGAVPENVLLAKILEAGA